MRRLVHISVLSVFLLTGCTQGWIGESGADAGVDQLLIRSLELAGSTLGPHTVSAGDRSDDDGAADEAFHFTWTLADCHEPDCLPPDLGEARTHVFRLRATNSIGEHLYKKVAVTLYP